MLAGFLSLAPFPCSSWLLSLALSRWALPGFPLLALLLSAAGFAPGRLGSSGSVGSPLRPSFFRFVRAAWLLASPGPLPLALLAGMVHCTFT